ncbi:MAG TPA: hypothetical protein PKD59_15235 [Miltoncostaeaceae bacterium]|nr:hypothetical protein [Miltoncostaeaceae bacterium]
MTDLSDEFRLDVPVEEASWLCREAVVYLDWPLLESIEPRRLVLKKGMRFATGSFARVEVLLSEEGPDATTVRLNAKYPGGIGTTDQRTVQSLMNTIRNAVEVLARKSSERG